MVTFTEHRLDNGLRVIIVRRPAIHSLFLAHVFAGGAIDERAAENGLTHVLEHMIGSGTERYPTMTTLQRAIQVIGGGTNASTDMDEMQVYLTCHPSTMVQGVRILEDMIFRPRMTQKDLTRERAAVIEELLGRQDDPDAVFNDFADSKLFPNRAEGRPVGGTIPTVRTLTLAQVRRRYAEVCQSNQQVFIAAGDVDEEKLLETLRIETARIRLRRVRPREQMAIPRTPRFGHLVLPVQQTHLKLFFHIPFSYLDPRWPRLRLMTSILATRLFRRLRERHALVYGVRSDCWSQLRQGHVWVSSKFDPAKQAAVLRDIADELHRLYTTPVSAVELRNEIRQARYALDYAKDDVGSLAEGYATQRNDAPDSPIRTPEVRQQILEATTAKELQAFARAYLRRGGMSCMTMAATTLDPHAIARRVVGR